MEQLKNADGVTEDGSQRTFISAILEKVKKD